MLDLNSLGIDKTRRTISCSIEDIEISGRKLVSQLRNEDILALILLAFFPIKFYLTDLNIAVKFSSLNGIKRVKSSKEKTNIFLTSEVLNYCLKFNWGFGATDVNGRYQTNNDHDSKLFTYYVSVTDSLNHKDSTFKRVLNKVYRKVKNICIKVFGA